MSKRRKRILLIGPMPPPPGGVSMHLARLLELSKTKKEFKISVLDLRKRKWFGSPGVSRNWFRFFSEFILADIIHIHISKDVKVGLARLAKFLGKKIIYTQHNLRALEEPATRKILNIADKIILVQQAPETLEKFRNKISVIPAYLPATKKESVPEWFTKEFQKYPNVILSVAFHEPGKATLFQGRDLYGFDQILNVLESIHLTQNLNGWMLVLVDPNGTLENEYQNRHKEIENKTGIRLLYISTPVELEAVMHLCKLFIRSTWSDGDALSVREALANGIPVIASDCVKRPDGAILYKTGDVEDFEEKVKAVIQYPYRITFQQPDFSENLFELYRKI